jgi:hypothetical protein
MSSTVQVSPSVGRANRRLLAKLLIVAIGMFGFGFALAPFYEQICQVAGIRNVFQPDEAANTQVLGISTDSPFSHENWAKSVGISNYPLLSDVQRSVSKDYGVYWPDWNANVRATFIVDKRGKIAFVERYGKGELDPRIA